MNPRGPAIVWGILGFFIGAFPAFALAGPAFFADGPFAERLMALGYYAAAMFVLGLGGGALAGDKRTAVTIGLALPVFPMLLLLSTAGAVEMYLLGAAFVAVAFGAAWAGTLAGARLTAAAVARRRR